MQSSNVRLSLVISGYNTKNPSPMTSCHSLMSSIGYAVIYKIAILIKQEMLANHTITRYTEVRRSRRKAHAATCY